ncbi:MAG: hypothetical protein ABL958_03660 [Bdellovibrionia bacterium]
MVTRNRILFAIFALALSACQQSKEEGKKIEVDINSIKQGSGTTKQKAELVAQGAEQFALNDNFMHGAEILDVALEMDPGNVRARAYKALLKPALLTKGILVRLKPLVKTLPLKSQTQYDADIAKMPPSTLKTFLLDGKPDITNETDAQNWVRQVRDALRESRAILTSLKNEKITLRPLVKTGTARDEMVGQMCRVANYTVGQFYQATDCDLYSPKEVKMDFSDWEALRFTIVGMQVYYTLWNAYDLTGAISLSHSYEKYAGQNLSQKSVLELIAKQTKLGLLNDAAALRETKDLGGEAVEAIRSLMSQEATLCSNFKYPEGLSRGGFIGQVFACIPDNLGEGTEMITNLLRGATEVAYKVYNEYKGQTWLVGKRKTTVNFANFINGSITDLKSQLPNKFDACGNVNGIADPTVGGIFPNGDALGVARSERPDFLRSQCAK